MHCGECCLPLRKTKAGTVPVHYLEDVHTFNWVQRRCPASGTTRFVDRIDQCTRPRSRRPCPSCDQKFTLNKNGKFPAHKASDGRECRVTRDNRA